MADEKYRLQLEGSQVDDALLQMNQRVPEGWAVGTRDGVPVGSGSQFYHNNAKYYAEQAGGSLDAANAAAARAEAAVPAGTAGAVFFDRQQNLTAGEQEQARGNIACGETNTNLLDNWYWIGGGSQQGGNQFPINSRGKTSYSGVGGFAIDRWEIDGGVTLAIEAGGLRISTSYIYAGMFTRIPANRMDNGSVYTYSIIVDGQTYSGTFTADASGNWFNVLLVDDWYVPIRFIDGAWELKAINCMSNDGFDHLISAAKLEKATYSTLSSDLAPDYGQEYTKCVYSKAFPNDPYAQSGFGRTNPNLLDNWYFVGGGSQLGGAKFPINQRGLTSYASGRGLDRWSSDTTLTIYSDGIASPAGAVYQACEQELTKLLLGKTVTASVLLNDGTLISGTATFPSSLPTGADLTIVWYPSDIGLCTIIAEQWTQFFRFDGSLLGGRHVAAVKLELGTVSTLANDVPPNFQQELAKCQRYLYVMGGGAPYTIFGSGVAEAASYIMATVQLSVPMRVAPTVSVVGSFRLWGGVGYEYVCDGITQSSAVQMPVNCPYVGISCSTSSNGLTIGKFYDLQSNNNTGTQLIFSAEL